MGGLLLCTDECITSYMNPRSVSYFICLWEKSNCASTPLLQTQQSVLAANKEQRKFHGYLKLCCSGMLVVLLFSCKEALQDLQFSPTNPVTLGT